ncbi:hypothetical protein EDB85DRAFT_1890482 [Lactarius pseudohatsudake]|nr:hypothetical protein EDB85DRAFT_1890482 [Lactarius pseudohatsudake]
MADRDVASQRDHTTDFVADVLPVSTGHWSIFALLGADDSSNHGAVSWIRRNIIAAVADAHSASHLLPSTHADDALRNALVRLDERCSPEHGMLAVLRRYSFFDSGPRVLHVANTGLRHPPSSPARLSRYLELEPAWAHRVVVEELVDEGVFSSCGSLDASSVETCSVEVRDGVSRAWVRERLVLYEGSEAVRAVGAWIREQEELAPEGRRWSQDLTLSFDFPREYEEDDLGLGLDVRKVAALVRVTGHRVPPTSSSSQGNGGSVMVMVFADAQSASLSTTHLYVNPFPSFRFLKPKWKNKSTVLCSRNVHSRLSIFFYNPGQYSTK